MSELHVFKNDVTEWVVAASPEDATQVLLELGTSLSLEELDTDWVLLPDDATLPMNNDDDDERETKTCGEWASSHGRGLLGSSEY
jgi:hypothetical protein